jgi:poly-gamma-glutamate capsule biosynthesis protein CapA/YwtB (metallophosphatase superfamily)
MWRRPIQLRSRAGLPASAVVALAIVVAIATGGVALVDESRVSLAEATPSAARSAGPVSTPLPTPPATASPAPTPGPPMVPLVPIVNYWSAQRTISRTQLASLVGGTVPGPSLSPVSVAVSAADLDGLGVALDVTPRGALAMTPAQVLAFVKATPNAIGIVRASDVALGVRALSVNGVALFGVSRTHDLAGWPLLAPEPGVADGFSTAAVWTMAAGGDVMLDKAVYEYSVLDGYGVDYAWDGGTATIDRRYCCGWGGGLLAQGRRTGNTGAFGNLFRTADLSLVNLESPEPHDFRYHAGGFTFTGDPDLLAGLQHAGIDLVSMANNHLGDGGLYAVADEIGYLDKLGIAHAGAGANRTEARKAAWLSAGGIRVAVLAYCWIAPMEYWATSSSPGSSGYSINEVTSDIADAKAAGADYVIVMPHWGLEYTDDVMPEQSADAQRMIDAGANLVLGSHSHWFGPMQQIGADSLVFYSFGDLVFDWTHDERTQESAVADMTFVGGRLVQVDLHPTVIIDGQPNLLDGTSDGAAAMEQIRATSGSLLGW